MLVLIDDVTEKDDDKNGVSDLVILFCIDTVPVLLLTRESDFDTLRDAVLVDVTKVVRDAVRVILTRSCD